MRPRTTAISGGAGPQTSSLNFKPKSDWKHEEAASFLSVYLPGFGLDQLKVTPDYSNRTVKIEGQRRPQNNILLLINETFSIPEDCDLTKMDKQAGRGVLVLGMPRNVVPQTETTKEAAKEESKTTPETSKSQEDEETAQLRDISTAGFEKQGTDKAGTVTPATTAVDGAVSAEAVPTKLRDENSAMIHASSDGEKLVEKKEENSDANGEPSKPQNPTDNLVQHISGVKEKESKQQKLESTMPSATAAAEVEGKKKSRDSADHSAHVKGKEAEKGNANVSAKKGMVNEPNQHRKLMVNVGAAVLIMGLGVSLFYTLRSS